VLHFGASAEYRNADSNERARFRSRPESSATDVRLVDSGGIAAASDLLTLGGELALKAGPVLLQSEFLTTDLSRDGTSDLSFSGWYVGGSYVIGGRQRSYARHTGSFGSIKPRSNWGALEVVARYGTLDLSDDTVAGGEETNTSIGVNWYWRDNFRVLVDYVDVDAKPNSNGVNESPSIVQARVQFGF
jgi:phosphate-selective porin OprO/OprP